MAKSFDDSPDEIVTRLAKRFGREDRGTGLIASQLLETSKKLQDGRGAGELLARAFEMEVEHYSTAVRNDLRTAHRHEAKILEREQEAIDTFRTVIRFQDRNETIEEGTALRAALRRLIEDPKTDTTLRCLAQLILQNPAQSNKTLAGRLGIDLKTVRALKAKLREL